MAKNILLRIDSSYKVLYRKLINECGKDKTKAVYSDAEKKLSDLYKKYADIPKGEKAHTDKYIFPRIAMFRAMETELGNRAMEIMEDLIREEGQMAGGMMRKITALPLMERVFLKIFRSMAKNQFGESKGFSQKFYETPKGTVRFDILDCPYCRYCRICNCPELIHTFCDSDAYCFGNLSKLTFKREETLENGDKCDFMLYIDKKKDCT